MSPRIFSSMEPKVESPSHGWGSRGRRGSPHLSHIHMGLSFNKLLEQGKQCWHPASLWKKAGGWGKRGPWVAGCSLLEWSLNSCWATKGEGSLQVLVQNPQTEISLVVQWLRHCASSAGATSFLPSASSILYHRDFLAAYTRFPHSLILKEHCVLICLQLSEVGSYCWVDNIPLIYYNFYPFSSQQSIIILIAILLPWDISS